MDLPLTAHLDVTIAILCGGRGSRMGGLVKPLLETPEGPTIVERIEAELGPSAAAVVIVAPEALAPALTAVVSRAFVPDPGRGPGVALACAARSCRTAWLLAVGGDQPRPARRLLTRLLAGANETVDAVAVELDGVLEPLWALYRREALLDVSATSASPSFGGAVAGAPRAPPADLPSLSSLLAVLRVLVIPGRELDPLERACFLDVDTPEDAAALGVRSRRP